MSYYQWSLEKNKRLKAERGVSFEQVVIHIERADILDIYEHPNRRKYPNQKILVVEIENYAYLVPFVESKEGRFLKTIVPSRKATRRYLGDSHDKNKTR